MLCSIPGVPCPDFNVTDGTVPGLPARYTDVINVTCDVGYETSDDTVMECLASGSWDKSAPTCSRMYP